MGNVLDSAGSTAVSSFIAPRFDIALELIETRLNLASLPWGNAAVEDGVHLFKSLALGFRCCQEHVDESKSVECAKDLSTSY